MFKGTHIQVYRHTKSDLQTYEEASTRTHMYTHTKMHTWQADKHISIYTDIQTYTHKGVHDYDQTNKQTKKHIITNT